ncbi:hypothetical protein [uncultured Aminobacterium sp.]|uniref:hypothetical protein n=1 Tax=uncultured Aminobacterium sp. TaxID=548265 RepID=UPI0025953DC9|nr:hypothetical protein [uncultured Aminobacterium sp.]
MTKKNQLMQFDQNQVNMLVPTTSLQQVSPWHAARVSMVQANPAPDSGDVFKVGTRNENGKWVDILSPAKPLLMKIAAAAGIVWNWKDSGPVAVEKRYVCYKAVGAMRLPDGTWQPFMATKEIDLDVIEDETYDSNINKAEGYAADPKKRDYLKGLSPEEWAKKQTRTHMIQWRKNKMMRAETGAMLRVIRAALGMKSQYTKEELKKPFVVPRIDFSPDYSDPEVRQVLLQNGATAMAGLFGQSAPGGQPAFDTHDRPAIEAPDFQDEEPFQVEEVSSEDPLPGLEPESGPDIGPGVFPDQAPLGEGNEEEPSICHECGEFISDKVYNFSVKKFGRPLCYGCQKSGGGEV